MSFLKKMDASLLMISLILWSASLYAEDINVDSLLLEMDSLAEEVDRMTFGDKSKTIPLNRVEIESTPKVIVKTEMEKSESNKSVKEKTKTVITKTLEDPEVKTSGNTNKKEVETDKSKVAETKNEPEKEQVAQEKPKDLDDGFGDFKISKRDIDDSGNKIKRRIIRGRDPFAPSVAMVSEYQKKIDDENKKREEVRLAKQQALDKKNEVEQKRKEAEAMRAKQASAMKAKLVQARALALPKMKLKGFIRRPDQGVLALLDIKGMGTHIVRKGDTVSLGAKGTLRILEINNMSVTVKSGKVADKVVVR